MASAYFWGDATSGQTLRVEQVLKARKTTRAFIFSLIGGILILAAGVARIVVMLFAFSSVLPNIIDPTYAIFRQIGAVGGTLSYLLGAVEAVSGVFVIFAAAMIHHRPARAAYWGNWVLAWSFLSLVGTGGFAIGAILGIVGGGLRADIEAQSVS